MAFKQTFTPSFAYASSTQNVLSNTLQQFSFRLPFIQTSLVGHVHIHSLFQQIFRKVIEFSSAIFHDASTISWKATNYPGHMRNGSLWPVACPIHTFTHRIRYIPPFLFSADFWGAKLFLEQSRTFRIICRSDRMWYDLCKQRRTGKSVQICISASESIGFKSNVPLSPPFSVYLCFAIFLPDLSYRIHHNPYSLPPFRRHFAVSFPIPFAVVNLLMEVRRFLFITAAKTSSPSTYWLQIEFPSSFHLSSGSQAVRRLHFPFMHSAFTQLTLRLPLFSIL